MTNPSSGFEAGSGRAAEHPHTLDVIESDGEYTFVPHDVDDEKCRTHWITVGSGSVIDLAAWQ